jgi:hypothetical protein
MVPKQILAGMLSMVAAAYLAGCGGGIEAEKEPVEKSPANPSTADASKNESPSETDASANEVHLPPHKLGQTTVQIRAVVPKGQWTQAEFEAAALALRAKHSADSCVVTFLDSEKALEGWDGTVAFRSEDWSHWLARVRVEKDPEGGEYLPVFEVAVDPASGRERWKGIKRNETPEPPN